jgi:hypothetical protein
MLRPTQLCFRASQNSPGLEMVTSGNILSATPDGFLRHAEHNATGFILSEGASPRLTHLE